MSIQEAFFEVCKDADPAKSIYVSLYAKQPFYGGPEEGGWWGNDHKLIAYQQFPTQDAADAAEAKINELAKQYTDDARRGHGEQCRAELDWCEAKGIDDSNSVFGEVDGPAEYYVRQEETPGEAESEGTRHWE